MNDKTKTAAKAVAAEVKHSADLLRQPQVLLVLAALVILLLVAAVFA